MSILYQKPKKTVTSVPFRSLFDVSGQVVDLVSMHTAGCNRLHYSNGGLSKLINIPVRTFHLDIIIFFAFREVHSDTKSQRGLSTSLKNECCMYVYFQPSHEQVYMYKISITGYEFRALAYIAGQNSKVNINLQLE